MSISINQSITLLMSFSYVWMCVCMRERESERESERPWVRGAHDPCCLPELLLIPLDSFTLTDHNFYNLSRIHSITHWRQTTHQYYVRALLGTGDFYILLGGLVWFWWGFCYNFNISTTKTSCLCSIFGRWGVIWNEEEIGFYTQNIYKNWVQCTLLI